MDICFSQRKLLVYDNVLYPHWMFYIMYSKLQYCGHPAICAHDSHKDWNLAQVFLTISLVRWLEFARLLAVSHFHFHLPASLTHATPTFSFILLQNKLTAVRGLRTAEGCGGFNDFNWTEHARTIREVQKHIFHFCLFSRARAQSAAK